MFRLLLLLVLALPVSAQETLIRQVLDPVTDTHVEVLALFSKPSPGGYFPVRVKIANNRPNESHVRLDFESQSDLRNPLSSSSSFQFDTPGGKSTTRDILVPLSPSGGSYGGASVTTRLSGSMGEASNNTQLKISHGQPAVLLSEALFTPNASLLDSATSKKYSRSSRGGSSEFAAKFDPKQLPDDWLAFSGYDSLILTDHDWANVPTGAHNAILSWVRLGGQLVVCATRSTTAAQLGLPAEASFGSMVVRDVGSDLKLDAPQLVKLVADNPTGPRQSAIRRDFAGGWPLQKFFGAQTFRYEWFVGVLVVFAILVGPVNLFVFAKAGQRHRLFITTPLISLAASLVMVALILTQDGFGGSGMRRVLMEVRPDGDVNAAYIQQEQFCRTGVLTASDFTLAAPAIFQPVAIAPSRWARFTEGEGARGRFNLQPADGKIGASGDWFQSRSEHGHLLSAVVATRGRIETTDAPGTLMSTFEFPIETLYYLDESRQWHRADGITAGKRFTLTPLDASLAFSALRTESDTFANRNQQFLKSAAERPGHFVAITTRAPGIDSHPAIRWQETRTVITGPVMGKF